MKKKNKTIERNHDGTLAQELFEHLLEQGEQISKAEKVKNLLTMQKKFLKRKQALTDFKEPVLDLRRRDGKIETYERATAGKLVFTHSNGEERYITLRPEDQGTRDYGDKKIRWYQGHEDYPFADWNNPINDSTAVTKGYEMVDATNLKYQERIQGLKNKGKLTWLWVIGGIILALALAITIIPASFWERFGGTTTVVQAAPPTAGMLMIKMKNYCSKRKV